MPGSTSSSPADLWILILAGGVGSRFWPVSTPSRPKQLLPLGSERPLIVDTVERLDGLVPPERIRVLTGASLVEPIRHATGLPASSFLVEPAARGTCPVLAWAAWTIEREHPGAVLASIHADHVIDPPASFRALLADSAHVAAREGLLLTTAIVPTRPEPGYGYIEPGEVVGGHGTAEVRKVRRFVEKPDRETATGYVRDGYLWNSGIFVWSAATFLRELRATAPDVAAALEHLERDDVDAFFREVPVTTVDEAVLERSDRVGTVPATFAWDDVGAWEALGRTRQADADGNVSVGAVHAVEAHRNIVWSEDGRVVLFGVDDLVVVRTGDVTFVTTRTRSPDLKALLARLPSTLGGSAS
ncbi:MAG: mannose-1-phosphate guanylyltransferase [Gemmatimonadetes bacterium]|nr:mannose-1-phosphate guanylyltransferase [Gemmatimonadota bacterium]